MITIRNSKEMQCVSLTEFPDGNFIGEKKRKQGNNTMYFAFVIYVIVALIQNIKM